MRAITRTPTAINGGPRRHSVERPRHPTVRDETLKEVVDERDVRDV
jgi:hypothetical protein